MTRGEKNPRKKQIFTERGLVKVKNAELEFHKLRKKEKSSRKAEYYAFVGGWKS